MTDPEVIAEYERIAGWDAAMEWIAGWRELRDEIRKRLRVEINVDMPEILKDMRRRFPDDPREPPMAIALMGDKAWRDHVDEVRRRSYELSIQRGHLRRYP